MPDGISELGKLDPCPGRLNSQGLNAAHDDDDAIDIDLDGGKREELAGIDRLNVEDGDGHGGRGKRLNCQIADP